MPLLSARKAGSDRRHKDALAPGGADRRRCIDQRKHKVRAMTISDAEWKKYLEMPNLLEIYVEAPTGMKNRLSGMFSENK